MLCLDRSRHGACGHVDTEAVRSQRALDKYVYIGMTVTPNPTQALKGDDAKTPKNSSCDNDWMPHIARSWVDSLYMIQTLTRHTQVD